MDPKGDIEAPLVSSSSSFFQDAAYEDGFGEGDEEQRRQRRRFLLGGRSQSNTTSQVALVGADVCPIESLDYEYGLPQLPNLRRFACSLAWFDPFGLDSIDAGCACRLIESDVFKQDWRARGQAHILRYVALKWALCFLVRALAAAAGFVANLGVENVAGAKFVVTSNLMLVGK